MFDSTAAESGMEAARVAWKTTLAELELQMTRATFNTWLWGSELIEFKDGQFTVAVRNDYAKDWLENRLIDSMERTLKAIYGVGAGIKFVVRTEEERERPALELKAGASKRKTAVPEFGGFEPYQSNFVQTPKQYYEIVLPEGPPVLSAFVGQVIAQTIGVVINFHTNERREWWEASYAEIGRVCGVKSKASIGKAVGESRRRGYVVREKGDFDFKYRLRRQGEPVDK